MGLNSFTLKAFDSSRLCWLPGNETYTHFMIFAESALAESGPKRLSATAVGLEDRLLKDPAISLSMIGAVVCS